MKKTTATLRAFALFVACASFLCAFAAPSGALGDECTPYNWYFLKNDRHEKPGLDQGMCFINDYDCVYLNAETNEKVVYLTFDAGYENGNVAKILDALKKHNATGAFFILENLVRRATDLVKRMGDEGHLVCNHTAKHPDMAAITGEALFDKQLTSLEKVYTEFTGRELARFYRPPKGRFSKQNLKYAQNLGYTTVLWSFAYADWDNRAQPDPEKSLQKILLHAHPGMILLLHPTSETNAAIMDRLLTGFEEAGYRFGSLEEFKK